MLPACCASYQLNLRGCCHEVFLTPETRFPKADVVIGGPPCQPFSVIGHQRGLRDSRDGFPAFISAIEQVDPQVWLFENVRGLSYRNKGYRDEILGALRALGYKVEPHLINAVHYGVPQNRERFIVVGHRGHFEFPPQVPYVVPAGAALGALARSVPPDSRFLTPSMDAYVARYEKASHCVRPRDLRMNEPARTLTCRNLAGATSDMHRIRLPDGRRRRLSVREAARLQSFPDWFAFSGSETDAFNQIGNAVPPLLAYHLAMAVRRYLESDFRLAASDLSAAPLAQQQLLAEH